MTVRHRSMPLVAIASGLIGVAFFFIGDRYHLPVIPTDDFARGLWFGVCLGCELFGVALLLRSWFKPAS